MPGTVGMPGMVGMPRGRRRFDRRRPVVPPDFRHNLDGRRVRLTMSTISLTRRMVIG
jgi:hypothetical protein